MSGNRGLPKQCPFCSTSYLPPAELCRGCQADIVAGSTTSDGIQFGAPVAGLGLLLAILYIAQGVLGKGGTVFTVAQAISDRLVMLLAGAAVLFGVAFYLGRHWFGGTLRFIHPKKGTRKFII